MAATRFTNRMTPTPPPVYLVELFGEVEDPSLATDVCAQLAVALQQVHAHLVEAPPPARVDVAYDDHGEVVGVCFLDKDECLLACITTYRLERDTAQPTLPELSAALALSEPARTAALNSIFQF